MTRPGHSRKELRQTPKTANVALLDVTSGNGSGAGFCSPYDPGNGKNRSQKRKSHVKIRQNRKREQTSCQSNFSARAKFITPISVQVLIVFTDLARKMTGKIIIN